MSRKYETYDDLITGLDSEGLTDEDDELVGGLDPEDLAMLAPPKLIPRPGVKAPAKAKAAPKKRKTTK